MRRSLFAAQVLVAALIVRNWAYVTTYRLYLDRRVDQPAQSTAVEQFDVEGGHVVPRITTRGADRIAFEHHINQTSTFHVDLRPSTRVSYAVGWRDGSAVAQTLASGTADGPVSIVAPFPTGNGIIELTSDGAVAWLDPRVVRGLRVGPHLAVLAILITASAGAHRRALRTDRTDREPLTLLFRIAACTGGAVLAIVVAEAALRAAGAHLPAGIAAERHDLGDATRDARWERSPRFGRRLRARVDAVNEWRYGDIVRMGYIPPPAGPTPVHRFRFVTDAEGFRNASTRSSFDVAALGDSFTDAMTMDVSASWPAQLQRRLGVAVQNYGTAGFGPQQELLVLHDYVAPHRPRLVVLAFFAGNDLFDAEAFDEFQRSNGQIERGAAGWRVKEVFSRADTWYIVSALRAGATWLARAQPSTQAEAAELEPASQAVPQSPTGFDRGMFTALVAGRPIRWAFMPPYLNTLNFTESELRRRSGWTLTRDAILEMQRATEAFGGTFVVMFLPFKSQVYWPLLERTLSSHELDSALRFYLEGNGRPLDIAGMRRNRLAQNHMIAELCDRAAIPYLDTTPMLTARLEAGENVYFPDESHFNETGQLVVADALAAFVRERGLAR